MPLVSTFNVAASVYPNPKPCRPQTPAVSSEARAGWREWPSLAQILPLSPAPHPGPSMLLPEVVCLCETQAPCGDGRVCHWRGRCNTAYGACLPACLQPARSQRDISLTSGMGRGCGREVGSLGLRRRLPSQAALGSNLYTICLWSDLGQPLASWGLGFPVCRRGAWHCPRQGYW